MSSLNCFEVKQDKSEKKDLQTVIILIFDKSSNYIHSDY